MSNDIDKVIIAEFEKNKTPLKKEQKQILELFGQMGCRTGKTTLIKILVIADEAISQKRNNQFKQDFNSNLESNKHFKEKIGGISEEMMIIINRDVD